MERTALHAQFTVIDGYYNLEGQISDFFGALLKPYGTNYKYIPLIKRILLYKIFDKLYIF